MEARPAVKGWSIEPAPERHGRPPLERLLAALPWLARGMVSAAARLPVGSRIRRRALMEAFSRGFAAIHRGDPWLIQIGYEPDW
jgi:hypothetical protein